ncbi:MarR family winged helix-turn-helix transcriptional regulator [Gracilibacillus phocaeensis]|uniref:MarR family winged helix-turn-helix transcriptional regulator n=1 Tax=Gracilibacillus phocaeensis TaxID=2042304 RepID=UPI0010311D0C|nr:MarR family transcriptional regulator [Gracilibacillus phocaeensis]
MEGFFRTFMQVYRPMVTQLNDVLADYQLSYSLWQVIVYLHREGHSTLVEISSHYHVEKPSITRRVHRLEELNLIQVMPSENRREKVIQLTDHGAAIYQECRTKITELEHHVLTGLTEQEKKVIFQALNKIQKNMISKEGNVRE